MRYFMLFLSLALLMLFFSASVAELYFPTVYVNAPMLVNYADGIVLENGSARIVSGREYGILRTAVVKSPMDDITGFSFRLTGELPQGTKIISEIFWSYDGEKWLGPIVDREVEPNDYEGPHDGYLYANPYYTAKPPALYYRAKFHFYGDLSNSPTVSKVEFVFMDCGWTEQDVEKVSIPSVSVYPMPDFVPRGPDGWDCPIPDTFASGVPIYYSYVTHITIHHTAGATSTPTDPCAQMRNIWNYHVYTRGWNDIGYNFVLDHLGNIYHGRWNADLSSLNVRGAHVAYHNAYTMGFSVMGNFETDTLCLATLPAIYDLLSWKCDQYGIDPHGYDWNGDAGYEEYAPTILGHRDWSSASTACPGANFYPLIPMIRDSVALRIAGTGGATDTIIVDNGEPEFSTGGIWFDGTYNPSAGWDNDYLYCSTGGELDWAHWTPDLPVYGNYDVYMWWYAGSNRCNNVFVRIVGTDDDTTFISQQGSGSDWHYIGRYQFNSGSGGYVGIHDGTATDGDVVIADAVMWILAEPLDVQQKPYRQEIASIKITPNPFNLNCKIKLETGIAGMLRIFDLSGRQVVEFIVPVGKSSLVWSPKNLPPGIYLLKLETSTGSVVKKIAFTK